MKWFMFWILQPTGAQQWVIRTEVRSPLILNTSILSRVFTNLRRVMWKQLIWDGRSDVSRVCLFPTFCFLSTIQLLSCSMARFIPHFWKSQTIFTAWHAHMFILPTVISYCQNSYLAFVAIHYILKWYLWNTEDTILSPHFESFLNHNILKILFNSREKFFPACIDRTRKDSTQTSSDKERCRPLLTEEPKTADNGIKNCWQRGGKSTDGSKKTGETGPKNWRQMSRAGPKKRVKRRSEQRVDGFVDWGYNLCVFHRSVWQHSRCNKKLIAVQDSILHAKVGT